MAPVSTAPSAKPGGSAGQTVASSIPRVTPVPAAPGSHAVHSGGAGVVATPMTAQAGGLAQQISAQALLTLLQTLGGPLSGTVQAGGSAGSLPLQLTMPRSTAVSNAGPLPGSTPQSGAQPAAGQASGGPNALAVPSGDQPAPGNPLSKQSADGPTARTPGIAAPATNSGAAPHQLATNLPVPKGVTLPASGTPVQVQAEGSGTALRIGVTVTGQAPVSPDSLRADAARQASLVPLMGDVAKLAGQQPAAKGVMAAIERLMGFTLDADAPLTAHTLRAAVEGARGSPSVVNTASGSAPSGSTPTGLTSVNATQTMTGSQTVPVADRPATPIQSLALPQTLPPSQPGAVTANTMQTALGALIRALGLLQVGGHAAGEATAAQTPATGKAAPPPQSGDGRPSKLAAMSLPADAPDIGNPAQLEALKGKAEAALSRLNLLQAQDPATVHRGGDAPTVLRWDVPLLIGQEAALLGVAIDEDGRQNSEKDGHQQTWRFRFAFESKTLGGIEGVVALRQPGDDQHIDVAVWADEPHVLARLEARRSVLVDRLQALNLTVDSLTLDSTDHVPEPAEHPVHHRVDVSS